MKERYRIKVKKAEKTFERIIDKEKDEYLRQFCNFDIDEILKEYFEENEKKKEKKKKVSIYLEKENRNEQ